MSHNTKDIFEDSHFLEYELSVPSWKGHCSRLETHLFLDPTRLPSFFFFFFFFVSDLLLMIICRMHLAWKRAV
jgi:hypothetical protein